MKMQEDLSRREVEYQVGEKVYLKLQPYRQRSVAQRKCVKLSARFYGPYEILQRVGQVAYKLDLPPTSKIHPVFHVSQLRKAVGIIPTSVTLPPEISEPGTIESCPELVLGIRNAGEEQHGQSEVLIKWIGKTRAEATWEQFENIDYLFPDFNRFQP